MHSGTNLTELKALLNEYYDLYTVLGLIQWDKQTYMPHGGSQGRSYQLSSLSKVAHLKITSPEIGRLLEECKPFAETLDPDSDDARLIKVTARRYKRLTKVPVEWISEFARVTGEAHHVWEHARADSDFSSFQPYLKRIVEMRREYAGFFQPYDHIYDPFLDEFEPGMKTVDVQKIFARLRPSQVALIQAIAQRPQVDDSFLHQPFSEKSQWDFGVEVITRFGYDWNRGRQDKAAIPSSGMGLSDVRITTASCQIIYPRSIQHYPRGWSRPYVMGIDPNLDRTPLGRGPPWQSWCRACMKIWSLAHPISGFFSTRACKNISRPNWVMCR
jgi:carboxypeptidase Taq